MKLKRRNHGSIYIAVFGVSMIVLTLAIGGILAGRVQQRTLESDSDIAEARRTAQAGLTYAKVLINQDASWRANRTSGTWYTNLSLGGRTVTISVVDPVDANLNNRPYDAVVLTAIGTKGKSTHTLTQNLLATPTPLPILAYPIHAGGEIKVKDSADIVVGSYIVSSNGSLRNEGVIDGNVSVASISTYGTIYGNIANGVAAKAMPAAGIAAAYTALGTVIVPPATINNQVLTPGRNPWGSVNAEGVYVINATSDITIRNTRINGTLVVNNPGRKVTIDGSVLFQPARSDYPVLIVTGELKLSYTSSSNLSELAQLTNFNPTGAAYQGATDGDLLDTYPSEIQGLVHVVGKVSVEGSSNGLIRGGIICEATGDRAIEIKDDSILQVIYTPSLFTSPPQFYTSQVPMIAQPGSLAQVVN